MLVEIMFQRDHKLAYMYVNFVSMILLIQSILCNNFYQCPFFFFQLFDAYGNHVEKGLEVHVDVDGFCFQDYARHRLKVLSLSLSLSL